MPAAWRVYYKDDAGNWVKVNDLSGYPVAKNRACEVQFAPVTTSALKLEVDLPAELSAGLFEWEVK